MAEEAKKADERKVARSQEQAKLIQQQNKTEAEAKRENARAEAKAKEEAEYLKRHNKTVKKVLSQVARHNTRRENDDPEDSEDQNETSASEEPEQFVEPRVEESSNSKGKQSSVLVKGFS